MDCTIPICRLCLSNDEESFEIFSEKGVFLDVASILSRHFWFEVAKEDSLPQVICAECWRRVDSFHELYLKVERKYKHFYNELQQHTNQRNFVNIKEEMEPLRDEQVLNQIDPVAGQDDDIKSNDKVVSNPEEIHQNDMIGENHTDENGEVEFNEDFVPIETNISEESAEDEEADDDEDDDDYIDDDEDDDDVPLKEYVKPEKPSKKSPRKKTTSKKKDKTSDKRKRYDSTRDNETVKKHFSMICDICGISFEDFLDARRHHRSSHNQSGYIVCCDKKFFKLYRVMQHCMWHENPEAFKCPACMKCYSDSVGLNEHKKNVHTPEELRTFACDLCDKTFFRKHMLTQHKRMQHISEEDKKFACHICGQRFIIKAFCDAHVRKVHENADSRVCDICAKFFKCSKSYEIHYMCVHSNETHKVQCELCGKWLKHQDSLKEHKRRHKATSEKCEFCGRVSANRKALRAHIRTAHRDPAYPCTICNKLFKKTQTLREHMAIHAGRTDLYSCSFCTKTFRSSANMYAHRKKAHPKEYEESRNSGAKWR